MEAAVEMLQNFQEWKKTGSGPGGSLTAFLVLAGFLLLIGLVVLYNSMIWSKTWITVSSSTIIMERNTINKTKNTIGMQNVSNVNLEQNIIEKLLGTCKVKLDTNSLSTANSTDVNILLKKKRAVEMKQMILTRVNAAKGQETEAENSTKIMDENSNYDVIADSKEVFMHGICCINLSTVLVLIGCVSGVVTAFATLGDKMTGSIVTILANLILVFGVVISCCRSILGGFITYHGFRAGRRGDKLYIHYGLFQTFDYTIPVDKINAVIIHQTVIGRFLKKYMVELVNVGMGDEKTEAGSYLILACDQIELQKQLSFLLPEFSAVPIQQIKRQPKEIIWNKAVKTVLFSAFLIAVGAIVTLVIPEVQWWMTALVCVPLIGYGILLAVLEYRTAGIYFDEKQLIVANGCFRRDITVIPYGNIQYFKFNTNVILAHWGLTKGTAHILASLVHRAQSMPAFEMEQMEPYLQSHYIQYY